MAKVRRQTYTMKQYLDNVREGYITNDADTQRNPAWKPIVDGLAITILTDDYVPSIILGEDENGGQIHIVDGGSRTASFKMIRFGNYKIKSSVDDSIVKYKSMSKDENGKTVWKDAEFDIRNKTFNQFPKELQKKFDEYQIDTVIHEDCNKEMIAKYIERYNTNKQMSAHQKLFTHVYRYATQIRDICHKQFFVNDNVISDNDKDKGLLERIVAESVMCMFHLDKWNKNSKKLSVYLNENSSEEEFEKLSRNIDRLENIVADETKELFTAKDTFIWLTFFNRFTELGLDDLKFKDFIEAFVNDLRYKEVDGNRFDEVDAKGSTKDKKVIVEKLHILETLMLDFLHINKEDIKEVDCVEFVKDNVEDVTDEDIKLYEEMLNDLTVNVDNNSKLLDKRNRPSLLALVGYSVKNDIDLDEWIVDYFANNDTYLLNQKENFDVMKKSLQTLKEG